MRKNKIVDQKSEFSILTLDDDRLMTETLQSYFQSAGYRVDIENDPVRAIERIRNQKYDILLLDFLMRPICGDEVVRQIREFNQELFIILLTGHKSMAPPIKTIRELEIQGYYEKSERFDQLELLVESCAKSIRQMHIIRNYRDGLQNILDQIPVLNQQQSTDRILEKTLEQITEIFSSKNAFAYFDLPKMQDQNLTGFHLQNPYLFRGTGTLKQAQEEAASHFQTYLSSRHGISNLTQKNLLLAPIFVNQQQYGLLAVQYADPLKNEDLQLFEVYSKQVGVIISNLLLRSMLQTQNRELRDTYATLQKNYTETIDVIRQIVDAKDFYTRGHSDRVSFYSVLIAQNMGKDAAYIEQLCIAGLFHDIGKIGIPDGILRKNGKLTDEEFSQIKQHPSLGCKILASVSSFHDLLPIIEAHHERYDGYGYPFGLHDIQIPEMARIISVADAFDAMTSKRTYRDSLTLNQAIGELVKGRNTQFDAQIVDIFLNLLEKPEELENQLAETFPEDAVTFKKG